MTIYNLQELPIEAYGLAGGKARGLAELIRGGLTVADGFVITGLKSPGDYETAASYFERCGFNKAAVRSSATAEDGADFSNAGQYSTFLNVEGRKDFIEALRGCMESLTNARAASYSSFFSQAQSTSMSVVVQKMADPACAGVCFTVNPATGKRELLVEAVEGLGESLVSGQASAEVYSAPISRGQNGEIHIPQVNHTGTILNTTIISKISQDAAKALEYFKHELDLEWALSKDGELIWLQARPITTLDEATVDELDSIYGDDNSVFTRCNIGEMLPGAVTPLSLSTSVMGIDYGLRRMLIVTGAYRNLKEIRPGECITSFRNHLFFNLTAINKMATCILGASKSDVETSICGKTLQDTPALPWKNKPMAVRIFNSVKYFNFLLSRKKAMKKIDRLVKKLNIEKSPDPGKYYKNIEKATAKYIDATYYHYITSGHSGAMSSALIGILKTEYGSEDAAKAVVAGLLEDIDNIESVDILRSMRKLALEILKKNPDTLHYSHEKLAVFIKNDKGSIREAYDNFIKRHGHRAIREAEMRNKSWKHDEKALMENIKMVMMSGATEPPKPPSRLAQNIEEFLKGKKGMARKGLLYLINQARAGVYNREYTKSKFVMAIDILKEAYDILAGMLVDAGALPEKDLIYFLTHQEIGELIFDKKAKLIKRAVQRRRLLDEQMEFKFNEFYTGKPSPVIIEKVETENGMILTGTPISRGEVQGTARIIKSVEDAKKLEKGEIMVAAFTDIGWSPYYSIIGGLVTEVGSALSHGAVVAREYALPLVVNVANATNIIKTGDLIKLDAHQGTVTILETTAAVETEAV